MITLTQCQKNKRIRKKHVRNVLLKRVPTKRGTVLELRRDLAPKKPNSAKRQCCQVQLNAVVKLLFNTRKRFWCTKAYGCNGCGGRVPDLPGVKYILCATN